MNRIEHVVEPSRLLLVWQRSMQDGHRRDRRVVGEIVRTESGDAVFRYLDTTDDFRAAVLEGFQGYPAFRLASSEHRVNVLHSFTSRMTSRKRGDFRDYLAAHFLPVDFGGSDFALLAHTGARLPGDGFEIVPDLSTVEGPVDLVIEVAGTRHQKGVDLNLVAVGDPIQLVPEPDNVVDPDAVIVTHKVGQLGYVPKPYCSMLYPRFAGGQATAEVIKLNGSPQRRLVYLLVRFY